MEATLGPGTEGFWGLETDCGFPTSSPPTPRPPARSGGLCFLVGVARAPPWPEMVGGWGWELSQPLRMPCPGDFHAIGPAAACGEETGWNV